ncbi:MAG: cysteine desulfurase family protein [Actinomycetes bacterium]
MTYLDHAATTPMLPAAVRAMAEHLEVVGNPSSLHTAGRRARRVVEESREVVAQVFGARPSEVVFTSGGTEANNLALKGLYWARRAAAPQRRRVVATAVEHHAVLDPLRWLVDHEDAQLEVLPVDRQGRLDPAILRAALERSPDDVALVSVMWANSEVGTVQPIGECAAIASELQIPFHTDAVQAAGTLDVDFAESGVDALTLTGHKLGGPHGVGALLLARTAELVPLAHGGGQERDVRSGTLDVPAIASLAVAASVAVADRVARNDRVARLRDQLVQAVQSAVPDAVLNGPPVDDRAVRLPGNAHFSFPGCEGDSLLMLLDAQGVYCSTGSACSAGVAQPSHVLVAMGADPRSARSSLRFSLGHDSTQVDVDALAMAIGPVVARARATSERSQGAPA